MHRKLITLVVGVVLVSAGLSMEAAAGSCLEARSACQPIGERSKGRASRAKAVPKLVVPKAELGGQLWRAGKHIMF